MAFSKSSVFGYKIHRRSVDGRPSRVNKAVFSNLPGAVWTQPRNGPGMKSHRSETRSIAQASVCAHVILPNPIRPRLFWVPGLGGGGGRKVPTAHNFKTIHGIEMKFGKIVENHKLINLV